MIIQLGFVKGVDTTVLLPSQDANRNLPRGVGTTLGRAQSRLPLLVFCSPPASQSQDAHQKLLRILHSTRLAGHPVGLSICLSLSVRVSFIVFRLVGCEYVAFAPSINMKLAGVFMFFFAEEHQPSTPYLALSPSTFRLLYEHSPCPCSSSVVIYEGAKAKQN